MESKVNVRKACKADSSKLLELILLKAEFDRSMKGFDGEISTTAAKIERTLFGEHPFAYALLLELNGEVLGFALFHYRYSSFSGEPSIWLDDLLVVGTQRSNGYGSELMRALKVEAVKSSASHISWTASPYNTRGHKFYKRLGAEVERMDGQRPYFRWETVG
ncbi:TPA: GNAT family N-acetyltransferase [Vibrio parahaemolyticus]|uniref:GNAT family N-acetyltransferase n=1 Tax=Vibrio parahaemolyticus TaxID=670 RepID=UPI00042804D6|nr:GNAT family N-acetyltransferase [Vibrio parahaemolyticus]EHK9610703.1 GNAT family N-acetyltransferase [Vibrio parahaemolyticus]EJG1275334.1 GNAT family N-acetyltransferase [Vibrio parahaemolyticus]EJG1280006.1 GNAT family N-acetyltransferase [Vibrio parahaemolyticus]EJG1289919.1 GNAT family N-acetyltransferase [Vibrio parahaemolyticus]EJG1299796.1 GNAT family N-acetyltransferase [Vibrio parahaemolyticus]